MTHQKKVVSVKNTIGWCWGGGGGGGGVCVSDSNQRRQMSIPGNERPSVRTQPSCSSFHVRFSLKFLFFLVKTKHDPLEDCKKSSNESEREESRIEKKHKTFGNWK